MTLTPLLQPYESKHLRLPNRIAMAPMTRGRADDETGVPHPMAATYYAQRATAGLIITEGVWPVFLGKGGPGIPGLATAEQVGGWQTVTDAVHAMGGRIFAQLWHVGRISHPRTLDGAVPLAPSAVRPAGLVHIAGGKAEYVTPRAMTTQQIGETIEGFARAARNAIDAGFDGVELHGANGYLIHQFLADNTNLRSDSYGGSVPNRTRFALETVDAVAAEVGAGRVAIRLAPGNPENDLVEARPADVYRPLVEELDRRELAYLHVSEKGSYRALEDLRPRWSGTLIGNYDPPQPTDRALGESLLSRGLADVVSFGRLFIANPDLPARFATGAPLKIAPESVHYVGGVHGYVD
ncbi:alkene reductase [Flindersiella endophytica]